MKISDVGAEEVRATQAVEKRRMKLTLGHVLAGVLVVSIFIWFGVFWLARWALHLLR